METDKRSKKHYDGYRFGFQGQEKDDEIKGSGNSYDFGARMYDPRIGRWMSPDPLASKYPALSPYTFVGNMPIRAIDEDGRDIVIIGSKEYQQQILESLFYLSRNSGSGAILVRDAIASEKTIIILQTHRDIDNHTLGRPNDPYKVMPLNIDKALEPLSSADGHNGEELVSTLETELAHELFHFLSKLKSPGSFALSIDEKKNTGLKADEVGAVEYENKVRKEIGLKERTHYKGVKVHGLKIVSSDKYKNTYKLAKNNSYAKVFDGDYSKINIKAIVETEQLNPQYKLGGQYLNMYYYQKKNVSETQIRIHDGTKNNL